MVARTRSGGVKESARRAARAKGHTLPGTDKFPINNLGDLRNAKHRVGTTTEPKAKVRAYINRRARELGGPSLSRPVSSSGLTSCCHPFAARLMTPHEALASLRGWRQDAS
jgi:hypothetical protein